MKRATFLIALLVGTTAFAQETLDMRPKHASTLDGSAGITKSQHGTGFDLDLGGTAVKDRVWFFASVEKAAPMFATSPVASPIKTFDTNATANLGDRQNLAATFASTTAPGLAEPLTIPSTFLSLHYTATLSSNSFMTMSYSANR